MKPEKFSSRDQNILFCLSCIPQKMLQLKGSENTTEFVLHELCDFNCFNFSKAAYFVDNPDFNCCKGVAGCCAQERYHNPEDAWKKPEPFTKHMESAAFNRKVRQMSDVSLSHKLDEMVKNFSIQLDIKNPEFYTWDLKHDNKGILIFEKNPEGYDEVKHHLPQGLSLLGFCPIF